MAFYPIYLKMDNLLCVVVGGGRVAFRKVSTILACGGRVRIVSESVVDELDELLRKREVEYRNKAFSPEDLDGAFLVVGATDDPTVNGLVYRSSIEKGLLVNIVDSPKECNFIVPSIVRRGDLCISVSTGGKSPAFAKKIRRQLEDSFGDEHAKFLDIMGDLRSRVIERNSNLSERMDLFSSVVESDALDLIRDGREKEAREKIESILGLTAAE